jgi:hypothetical protein
LNTDSLDDKGIAQTLVMTRSVMINGVHILIIL